MTQPQSEFNHLPSEDRQSIHLTNKHQEEESILTASSTAPDENYEASMSFGELAQPLQNEFSSQLTRDGSDKSLLDDKSCPKFYRRRSLEVSCMNLKIDLAESCTALDAVRQELTSSYSENSVLSEEVASLQAQLSEIKSTVSEQADIIRSLRKNAKESALERVKLRVQVESLQAECSRHKLQTRRFKDESARATAEAKEMRDVVHFMRQHTERLMLEKEEHEKRLASFEDEKRLASFEDEKRLASFEDEKRLASFEDEKRLASFEDEKRLASFEDEVVEEETQDALPKTKTPAIINWFGGNCDKGDTEKCNGHARSLSLNISLSFSLSKHEKEKLEEEEKDAPIQCKSPDDFNFNETQSQELPDKADLNSRRRLTPNWFTFHRQLSDEDSIKQNTEDATKKTRKGFLGSIIQKEDPDTTERNHNDDAVAKSEEKGNIVDSSSSAAEVITNAKDGDNNSSKESEKSERTQLSLPKLSSMKQEFQPHRVSLTVFSPQASSIARPA